MQHVTGPLAAKAETLWRAYVDAADGPAVQRILVDLTETLAILDDAADAVPNGIVACAGLLAQLIRAQPDVEAARLAVCGLIAACVADADTLTNA